jgi:sialate O-acetylesterase
MFRWIFAGCLGVLICMSAQAEIKLPSLVSDGMVLQQGLKLKIWGNADPGERISVSFDGAKGSTATDNSGKWMVQLGPFTAGGPYTMTIVGKNTITLHDVLVGEVWICSGQSNMEMTVGPGDTPGLYAYHNMPGVKDYQQALATADYPKIRLFTVTKAVANAPLTDVQGHWLMARAETVNDFSAVGYFFGRELFNTLHVPIGLIHASWGGTIAEAWMSRATVESDPDFKYSLDRDKFLLATYPKVFQNFQAQFDQWRKSSEVAEAAGKQIPEAPKIPDDPRQNPNRTSALYNGMIAPLTPYAIKGVIWYQGESNGDHPASYRKLFPALIKNWRDSWGEGDFPFLYVQLPNFGIENLLQYVPIREAQLLTLSVPNTGMVVTIDIGDAGNIHPPNKQDVGYRLALTAQAVAYGQDVIYSGPIYDSMNIEQDKIRIHFKHVYSGLAAKNWTTEVLLGFEIAGADKKFVGGMATIEGDTVVVRNPSIPHPVAVRYAWAMNTFCNLANQAGLPASPFRTDSW